MDRQFSQRHISRLVAMNRNRIVNEINNLNIEMPADSDDDDDDNDDVESQNERVEFDDDEQNVFEPQNNEGGLRGDLQNEEFGNANVQYGNDGDGVENNDDYVEDSDDYIEDSDDESENSDLEDAGDDNEDVGDFEDNGDDNEDVGNFEGEGVMENTFKQQLATFVRKSNLSCANSASLLKLLRENGHPELPCSRPSLLRTPRTRIRIRPCNPGEYYHFSLKKCLRRCNYSFLINAELVQIDINIDGVSLSKSSNLKMWPILGAFPGQPDTSPFLIGCYVGRADPGDIEVYLQEFIDEIRDVTNNGCLVTPQLIPKPFKIRLFSCDMPARSFVKDVLGHSSLYGCDRCHQQCYHINLKMIYQTDKGPERTDDTFHNRNHIQHHHGGSLNRRMLIEHEDLNIGMVSQFVIDDMHLVHLGVTKRIILNLFIKTNACNSVYLQNDIKQILDTKYISFSPYIPSEFTRQTRSILSEVKRWKAVEFRLYLLYTGIVLLRDRVGPDLYQHFLLLSLSIRLLSSASSYEQNILACEDMLQKFVTDYPLIYKETDVVYNVHGLLHITEDVRRYGPIGSYSAYRFENHQRELKKHVKKYSKILQQINNRVEEIEVVNEINIDIGFVGPPRPRLIDQDIFPGCNSSYRGFKFGSFTLQNNLRDSCCLLTSSDIPVEVQEFVIHENEEYIIGKRFTNPRNFFTEPHESMDYFLIFLVHPPGNEIFYFKREEVRCKLMRLPYRECFVLIPLLHHLD